MKDQIRKYIVDTFMYGDGNPADNENLFESGVIDSLGFIKLLAFVNDKLNISIDMSEVSMEKFGSINDMVKTLEQKNQK